MIRIQNIMTKEVSYYDPDIEDKLKLYCKNEHITYLPSFDFKKVYFLHNEAFENKEIEKSLKITPDLYVFDEDLLKQFQKGKHILFVFDQNLIVGIIHFSDYNRVEVYTYLYELIANLERGLRKFLVLNNLSNNDMLKFFEKHASSNGVYKGKFDKYKDYGNKFNLVGPFESFELSDLVALCDDKEIIRINHELLELRNKVMHSVSSVKNEDYEQDPLIYNFESFEAFFNDAIKLQSEFRRIHNRVEIGG
ncbi:MAG: hypothetical protein COS15_05595 [Caldiserica bacterium CG02_land_8_20_14_3_00_36_38]|nr:hypothetical protein [Caldisericota bacterium]OIP14005.1 MAG: hypothetical protein AUJ99_00475 [Caldisericum sp. CG2_30_36_11]PIV54493.1 MAG: hypothetical protein COS15_05595 [Caldiserica bacterium CG02_land_8_20_14_3_00_36_38]PIW10733.1 MAG: hypothetical protein COW37_02425 [Caldiserica bacterium CG17_big_fil_post_rev_8_21_14_2_50_35_7]